MNITGNVVNQQAGAIELDQSIVWSETNRYLWLCCQEEETSTDGIDFLLQFIFP